MYVVRRIVPDHPRDGRIVGTTSLGDLDLPNEKVHLGWTAYARLRSGARRSTPSASCWCCGMPSSTAGFGRVKLQTDSINTRSQAAIAKLGATREGITRRDIKRADGSWRDSVVFSVIIDDWPEVKAGLERRLAASWIRVVGNGYGRDVALEPSGFLSGGAREHAVVPCAFS